MKKFLAILLAICMVFAMSSVAMAANVAQIGDTEYATLAEAIEAVDNGDVVIELLADATLDYGAREAYGTDDTKSVTINGNGNTLTLHQTDSDWSSLGLKNAEAKLVLNNMTIEKTGYGDTDGAWNTHTINILCDVEMNSVSVYNSIAAHKGATLKKVSIFEAGDYYALWITGEGQTVTVTECDIIASRGRGIKVADQYVDNAESVTLNVTDTYFNTRKKAAVLVSSEAGAKITAEKVNIKNVREDNENFVQVDEDWAQYNSKVIVEGCEKAQEGMDSMVASIVKDDVVQGYYSDLEDAFNAAKDGDTITLLKDFDKDVIVSQKENVKITIDGADKTFSGTITVDGKSKRYETAAVTIKNVNFNATGITKDACINLGVSGDNNTRYTNNVTVENCTFTGKDQKKVAVKSYTGGDWNLVVRGCTVDNTMHSLMQVPNVEKGLVIEDCTVKSKNGINLNSTPSAEIKNSKIEVGGYAVRLGVDGQTITSNLTLTGNTLKTDNSGSDAVVVFRGTVSENTALTMSENVVSGDTHISGGITPNENVSIDNNYWDGQNGPTVKGTDLDVTYYYKDEALKELAKKESLNYVSIGDSMSNGYCFEGYEQGNDDAINFFEGKGVYGKGAYPLQFEEYLETKDYNVNHTKLALSAMRAEDLNYLLGGREMPHDGWEDEVFGYAEVDENDPAAVAEFTKYFQDSVANADVMTYCVGNASFGAYLLWNVTDALGVMQSAPGEITVTFEQALKDYGLNEEQSQVLTEAYDYMLAEFMKYVPADVAAEYQLESICDLLAYTTAGFLLNYEGSLDRVIELNNDAEIILIGLMNTTYGMEITGEGFDPIPVGDIMDGVFGMLNAYIAGLPTAKQAAGEWADATFYYAEQPNPLFISQQFANLKAAGWENIDCGIEGCACGNIGACPDNGRLSGNIVRERNIRAYNNSLRGMIGGALGFDLPKISLENVTNYNGSYTGAPGTANFYMDLSTAIYLGIEDAVAASCDTMEIPLSGLEKIAGDLGSVFNGLNLNISSPAALREDLGDYLTSTPELQGMCKIYALFKVGDGMSVHPTPSGHDNIADAVIEAYENGYTAKDKTVDNAIAAGEALYDFWMAHGEEMLAKLYAYAEAEGYIDQLETAVAELLENAKAAVDAEIARLEAELEALKEQYGVDEKIAAIEARIAELEAALERIEDDCNRIMDSVAQIESDLNALDSIIKGETEATLKDVEALVADIIKEVKNIEAAATDLLETVDTYIADLEAAGQAVAEALNAAADALGTATDALADLIGEYGDDFAQAIYNFAEEMGYIDMMEDALADMEAKAVAQLEAVIAELEAQLAELEKLAQSPEVQAQIEAIKAEIAKAEAALAELQKAIDEAYAFINNIETYVNEMIAAITEGAEAELEKLEAAIAAELEKLDAAVAAALEELKAAAENAANEALAELEALAAELEAQWNALVAEIEKAYANATFAVAACGNHNYLALGGATTAGILVDTQAVSYVNVVADYFGDKEDFKNKANANLTVDGLVDYVKANDADIEAATVITYNMDATHFVNAALNGLAGDAVAWDKYLSAEEIETVNKVKAAVLKELAKEIDAATLELLAPVVENLAFSAVSYGVETVNAVETIQAINEDALLIVTGMYNPFVGLNAKVGGEVFDLGEAFEYVIEATNAYYLGYAMIDGNTLFVDISDAEITGFDGFTIDLENPLGTAVLMRAWNNMFANAKGHAYIAEQICNAVDLTDHAEEIIPAVEATCTETGLTEGKKCSVCGEILVAQEEVAALGHTEEIIPAVAATCTETGLTEGKKCSVCGEILVAQEEVAALGHTEEIIPAVAATCTETGLTEGKKCSVCGEILVAQETVEKLAHNFVINEKREYVCSECGISKEEWESFPFDDIGHGTDSPHWAYNYIRYVYENGIMNGIGDRKFDPEGKATRAMIVTMLYRMETGELNKPYDGENVFTDLEDGTWYTNAMLWATDNGILKGYGDGTCGPKDVVTREQFGTFMYRYAELKGLDLAGDHDLILAFPADGHTVSSWAVDAMSWATGVGLFQGNERGELIPLVDTNRATVATVFYRLIEEVL